MTKETMKELKAVADRYSKYGTTLAFVLQLYKSGIDNGMSPKASVIGVRMALSGEFKEQEYFTAADVAAVTGETVEEVNRRIEADKENLMQQGGLIEVSSPLPGLFQ